MALLISYFQGFDVDGTYSVFRELTWDLLYDTRGDSALSFLFAQAFTSDYDLRLPAMMLNKHVRGSSPASGIFMSPERNRVPIAGGIVAGWPAS